MLSNPVKTKSMVITTRQKHQLSDLSLRLSLDGQNIEKVTEHRLLGLNVDNKFRRQAQIEHLCKSMSKKCFFFPNCSISSTSLPEKIFYNASNMYAKAYLKKKFLLSQLQHIINIDTRKIL